MAKQIVRPSAPSRPSAAKASSAPATSSSGPVRPVVKGAPKAAAKAPPVAATSEEARKLAKALGQTVTVRPNLPGKAVAAAPAAPSIPAAILAKLESAEKQIATLTARLAKATAKASITLESALADASELPAKDWRKACVGTVALRMFTLRGENMTVSESADTIECLIAIPRDEDRGGAAARNGGLVAIFNAPRKDGTWEAPPCAYINAEELSAVWPE